ADRRRPAGARGGVARRRPRAPGGRRPAARRGAERPPPRGRVAPRQGGSKGARPAAERRQVLRARRRPRGLPAHRRSGRRHVGGPARAGGAAPAAPRRPAQRGEGRAHRRGPRGDAAGGAACLLQGAGAARAHRRGRRRTAAPRGSAAAGRDDGGAAVRLEWMEVRTLDGLNGPLEARGFVPGVNVVVGPNASGKSSLVRALRAALYPDGEEGLVEVRLGLVGDDGSPLVAHRLADQVRWARAGREATRPPLPPREVLGAYVFELEDLTAGRGEATPSRTTSRAGASGS